MNSGLRRFGMVLGIALWIWATPAAGQVTESGSLPDEGAGVITGSIVDKMMQQPVASATVQVVGMNIGVSAKADGTFTLRNVPAGARQIRVSCVGYEALIRTDVIVTANKPVEVRLELNPKTAAGSTVTVVADYFQKDPDVATSQRRFSSEEIRRLPGGFEDVVRAISVVPGVAQAQNGRNDLLVRGGAPSENLFLIDNIESPNINHFGTQGAGGGPLSFVNLDFVRDVSFSSGGFGVKYGDRISSALSIDLQNGRRDRTGGKATISASQFGLNLEGPVTDDAQYLFSARRSYLDLIFRAAGFSFIPEYWDFLGKATWKMSASDQISALAIAAIDRVNFDNATDSGRISNSQILDNTQNQLVAGITWKHQFADGFVNTTFSRSIVDYAFRQSDAALQPVFTNTSLEDEFALRGDLAFIPTPSAEISAGFQAKTIGFTSDLFLKQGSLNANLSDRFYKGALYGQYSQAIFTTLRGTIGGRVDYFSGIEKTVNPSVRASLMYSPDDRTRISMSGGRYYQAPSYIWLVANSANRGLKDIRTDVAVIGIEHLFAEDFRVSLEGYYKGYQDYPAGQIRTYLVLANTGAGFGGESEGFASFGLEPLVSQGTGAARGVELYAQKKFSDIPCYGAVSLSVNQSEFTALDGITRPGNYDQRLIFNVSGGYKLTDLWEFGLKFRYASGRPYTAIDTVNGDPTFGYQDVRNYNGLRLGASHSLDLRVERRWPFSAFTLITYIDVQNVYNHKNPNPPRFNTATRGIETLQQIGLLPTIGISAEF